MSSTGPKTIVMCGETGMGKSTLGNLIVQAINPDENSPFKVMHCSMSSPMAENVVATVKKDELDINVVDTPGFGDTGKGPYIKNVQWKLKVNGSVVVLTFTDDKD